MIARRLAISLLTALLSAAALLAPAAGARSRRPAPMRFTAPALIDHAGTAAHSLQALACPSASLCVAADDTGSVLTTTDPGRASATWDVARVDDAGGLSEAQVNSLVALACPSVRLCLGVDGDGGGLLSSTRPAGGTSAWHRIQLPGHPQLAAVSCPSTRLCLAADFAGGIDVSTHPTGPAADWTHTTLPRTGPELSSLTCPSVHLCLAGGTSGVVYVSTDPATGGRGFHRVVADPGSSATTTPSITAVACRSTSWCVAVDSLGGVLTTRAPAGPAGGWTRAELDPGVDGAASAGLAAVTCRASGLCTTVDPEGDVWASAAPGAAFTQVTAAPANATQSGFAAIACPSATQCLAVGASGGALRSSAPATAGSWRSAPVQTNAGQRLTGVSCPTASLCVAIDSAGDALWSTDPARAASWHAVDVDASTSLAAIDCPSARFCAIADTVGDVLTSDDPTGPASAWSTQQIVPPVDLGSGLNTINLTGMACGSAQLCITGDEDPGQTLTSTDPTRPASAWNASIGIGRRYGDDGLDGAACSSTSFCVTISGQAIHATTDPAGNGAVTRVMVPDSLDSVSCTSRTLCAAVQGQGSVYHGGDVWRSANPAAAHPAWRRVARDPREQLGIACHGAGLCVAVDAGGRALIAFAPRSPTGRWSSRDVDGLVPLTGVSCPTTGECVAVDAFGRVVVGRR